MRTHTQILQSQSVAQIREALSAHGIEVSDPAVRSWMRRPDGNGSIPAGYWSALTAAKITTLAELAAHASAAVKKSSEAA